MKRFLVVFAFFALSLGLFQVAPAQNTATQDVTINVSQITALAVNGGGVTFDFTSSNATAGSDKATITKSESYSLFTNVTGGVKITGTMNADFATGITLKANLNAPSAGGSSQGTHTLSTGDTELVSGIPPTSESGISIDYTAEITPQAAASSGTTQTVTYTLTAN